MLRAENLERIAVSKVSSVLKDGRYFMSGQAFVYTPSKTYRIPFGAEDASFSLCAEKTKSELIERLTWMNIFLLNRIFQNTFGFAAHTDIHKAAINSILENNERRVFKELCERIVEGNVIPESFQICKKNHTVIFVKPLFFKNEKYYLAYAFSNNARVAFGMGKDKLREDAIETALLEKTVVQQTLMKEVEDRCCMTYEEWHKFNEISVKIGCDNDIFTDHYHETLESNPEEINANDYAVYDIEGFVPVEVQGKRKVTLCIGKSDPRNEWLEENGIHAIEI